MIADSHASMYNDSPLSLHSSNIRGDVSYSEVANYVSQFISEHPYTPSSRGTEYIRSTHLDDIVLGSTHVVKVTPIELLGIGEGNHTERYLCTVDNVLSGSVTTKNLSIIFIEDTVEPGNQYIVMLNWKGSAYCSLSSKNSVYPANDDIVKQIEDILNSKR